MRCVTHHDTPDAAIADAPTNAQRGGVNRTRVTSGPIAIASTEDTATEMNPARGQAACCISANPTQVIAAAMPTARRILGDAIVVGMEGCPTGSRPSEARRRARRQGGEGAVVDNE